MLNKLILTVLTLISPIEAGANVYRELKPEITFRDQIALTRRDESSGATVNALSTTKSYIKLTSTVTTINGAVAPSSPSARYIVINNNTGGNVVINHESGSASAANRFVLQGGLAITLKDKQSVAFIYDHGQTRWVVAAGSGSGSGSASVTNTRGSPGSITAGGGITPSGDSSEDIYIQGSGAAVDVTANPQIADGVTDGQRVCLIGRSNTNYVLLENGTGLVLNGSAQIGADDIICLRWDTTDWVEVSRNF
jgi:hypothetical protein